MGEQTRRERVTFWVVMGTVAACFLVFAVLIAVDDSPSSSAGPEDGTRERLTAQYLALTSSERLQFCAEVNQVGHQGVLSAMRAELGDRLDVREARYWLEDTCG